MNKVETLEYGFERAESGLMVPSDAASEYITAADENMFLDSPSNVFDQVIDGPAGAILKRIDPFVSYRTTPDRDDGMRVVVNFDEIKKIDEVKQPYKRVALAGNILRVLDSFYAREIVAKKDPFITITRANNIAQGGKTEMTARLILPPQEQIEDKQLAGIATARMLTAADAFKYKPHRINEKLVFATVDRDSGVSFRVDSTYRHRSFSTLFLNSEAGSVNLIESSLIKDYRRVICFVGAVAIAAENRALPKGNQSVTITE